MAIVDIAGLQPHMPAGRPRGLAIAGPPGMLVRELPSILAVLPGVEGTAWHGVIPPRAPRPRSSKACIAPATAG